MKQGTVSWFIGCHSVFHSWLVIRAWHHLYSTWPDGMELVCILVHDIGHIGKQYLDDIEQKKEHWELGARIARSLFGHKGWALVAGHCEYSGAPHSLLYFADKYSWMYEPYWWAWWQGFVEPKLRMGYSPREAYRRFQEQVHKSIEAGEFKSTHQMYLEKCIGG